MKCYVILLHHKHVSSLYHLECPEMHQTALTPHAFPVFSSIAFWGHSAVLSINIRRHYLQLFHSDIGSGISQQPIRGVHDSPVQLGLFTTHPTHPFNNWLCQPKYHCIFVTLLCLGTSLKLASHFIPVQVMIVVLH